MSKAHKNILIGHKSFSQDILTKVTSGMCPIYDDKFSASIDLQSFFLSLNSYTSNNKKIKAYLIKGAPMIHQFISLQAFHTDIDISIHPYS